MADHIAFTFSRLREKLWVRPVTMCIVSIAAALVARGADNTRLGEIVPEVEPESIETLLSVIAASMLVIATFAVASMVSAYASASSTATPRSFALVVADDVSQNALSAFIGAFIFSIVALIAIQNGLYETAGRFTLFVLTLFVFAVVILTFLRWVDRIARLGRLGSTVDKVEAATHTALTKRLRKPRLGGTPTTVRAADAAAVACARIGYVQRVDVAALQSLAADHNLHIEVAALPGAFAAPGRALAYVAADAAPPGTLREKDMEKDVEKDIEKDIAAAFVIGGARTFDEDPRFGFVVLSEIASRALSPGINDPGTAIDVIGSLVRLFAVCAEPRNHNSPEVDEFDRVAVPEITLDDLFDDAFAAIARDGAGTIEVVIRLQKALASLASIDHAGLRSAAQRHARLALARAEQALDFEADLEAARLAAADFVTPAGQDSGTRHRLA